VAKIDTDNLKGGNVVAANLPQCGKNKIRVALICHLFGIECHKGGREFATQWQPNLKVAIISILRYNCHHLKIPIFPKAVPIRKIDAVLF